MSSINIETRLRELIHQVDDQFIIRPITKALHTISDPHHARQLTYHITSLRKKYRHPKASLLLEISCLLGELALQYHPNNTFILAACTNSLNQAQKPEKVVELLEDFLLHFPSQQMNNNDRVQLTINLSTAYRWQGKLPEAIAILDALPEKPENVVRKLVEYNYYANRYNQAISYAESFGQINWHMAKWYAKALYASGRQQDAIRVIEPFAGEHGIDALREQFLANPDLWKKLSVNTSVNVSDIPSVFLSYAWNDAATVNKIDQWLRDNDIRVVRDERDFIPGNEISHEIETAIKRVDKVIAVLSRDSKGRDWPSFELKIAEQRECNGENRVLIYLILDDTSLPLHDPNRLAIRSSGKSLKNVGLELLRGIRGTAAEPVRYDYNEDELL